MCCIEGPLVALGLRSRADEAPEPFTYCKGFLEAREAQASQERSRIERKRSQRLAGEVVSDLRFCEEPLRTLTLQEDVKFNPSVPRRIPAPADASMVGNTCIEEEFESRAAYHEQVDEDEDFHYPLLNGFIPYTRDSHNSSGMRVRWHNRYQCYNHPMSNGDEDFDGTFSDGILFSLNPGNSGFREQGYGRPCKGSEADMNAWNVNWLVEEANRYQLQLRALPNEDPEAPSKSSFVRNPDAPYCNPGHPYWETCRRGDLDLHVGKVVAKPAPSMCLECGLGGLLLFMVEALARADKQDKDLDSSSDTASAEEPVDYASLI